MDKPMGEVNIDLDINVLRKTYAVKVTKIQEEAFKELQKELYAIMDDLIEAIKKELSKNHS